MGVYSLVAESGTNAGRAFKVIETDTPHGKGTTLTRDDFHVSQDDGQVKESARQGGLAAFQYLQKKGLVHQNSEIPKCNFTFDFEAAPPDLIKGPSAGLCFLVKMGQLIIEDYRALEGQTYFSCDVAATGILQSSNSAVNVARVKHLDDKIKAACQDMAQGVHVFYPKENTNIKPLELTTQQLVMDNKITLVVVNTPQQALDYLLDLYGLTDNGDELKAVAEAGQYVTPAGHAILAESETLGRLKRTLFRKKWWVLLPCLIGFVLVLWMWRPSIPPCLLDATLFYEGAGGKAMLLSKDQALTEGDGYQVHIEVGRVCYLYVVSADSEHYLTSLFPFKASRLLFLSKGTHSIPKDPVNPWAEIDDVQGEETVLVFASTQPLVGFDGWRKRVNQSSNVDKSERDALRAELIAYFEREMEAGRGLLKRLTFQHQ